MRRLRLTDVTQYRLWVKVIRSDAFPGDHIHRTVPFMWSSNDFMGPLLYVNTPAKYPLLFS